MRLLGVLLCLALTAACSRQLGVLSSSGDHHPDHELPFDRTSEANGISPTQALASVTIPAGTPIGVVLSSQLSSSAAHPGDTFQATLNEPITVRGQILAPRGAVITGRVIAAKIGDSRHAGYLRITLSSIVLNGKALDLHTSGVFAKGTAGTHQKRADVSDADLGLHDSLSSVDAKFSTGRRLSFRLVQPLTVETSDLPKMAFAH